MVKWYIMPLRYYGIMVKWYLGILVYYTNGLDGKEQDTNVCTMCDTNFTTHLCVYRLVGIFIERF